MIKKTLVLNEAGGRVWVEEPMTEDEIAALPGEPRKSLLERLTAVVRGIPYDTRLKYADHFSLILGALQVGDKESVTEGFAKLAAAVQKGGIREELTAMQLLQQELNDG